VPFAEVPKLKLVADVPVVASEKPVAPGVTLIMFTAVEPLAVALTPTAGKDARQLVMAVIISDASSALVGAVATVPAVEPVQPLVPSAPPLKRVVDVLPELSEKVTLTAVCPARPG